MRIGHDDCIVLDIDRFAGPTLRSNIVQTSHGKSTSHSSSLPISDSEKEVKELPDCDRINPHHVFGDKSKIRLRDEEVESRGSMVDDSPMFFEDKTNIVVTHG